jgi:hypothetical protein
VSPRRAEGGCSYTTKFYISEAVVATKTGNQNK